jgi:hypothetical protein
LSHLSLHKMWKRSVHYNEGGEAPIFEGALTRFWLRGSCLFYHVLPSPVLGIIDLRLKTTLMHWNYLTYDYWSHNQLFHLSIFCQTTAV